MGALVLFTRQLPEASTNHPCPLAAAVAVSSVLIPWGLRGICPKTLTTHCHHHSCVWPHMASHARCSAEDCTAAVTSFHAVAAVSKLQQHCFLLRWFSNWNMPSCRMVLAACAVLAGNCAAVNGPPRADHRTALQSTKLHWLTQLLLLGCAATHMLPSTLDSGV